MSLSDELCRSYLDLRWHFDPAAATAAGVATEDARLGRFDTDSVGEHLAAFRALEAGVEELDVEGPADEIDRTALLDDIRVAIFRLQHERPHRRNPAFWLLHLAEALYGLLPGMPEDDRAAQAQARLEATPGFLDAAVTTLHEPPLELIEVARALVPPTRGFMTALARSYGPRTPAIGPAVTAAERALDQFEAALAGELAAHEQEHAAAVGLDQFERLLHHLHAVTAGASELWRYALHLEEEMEQDLADLAADLGAGDWRAALTEAIGSDGPMDFEQALRSEMERLARFAEAEGICDVSPELPAVGTLPPHLAVVTGHAAYRPRGWRGRALPARLFLRDSPSTAAWQSAILAALAVPGRHLQASVAERLGPEIRSHLTSRLTVGGWALHALGLVQAAGYWEHPVDRLTARSYLALQVELVKVDIGLHTGRFGAAEAMRQLRERWPLEAEVTRAFVWGCLLNPTEATGALLGRRALMALEADCRAAEGPAHSIRRHHDQVLAYGGLPVPLIRWGMGLEA